MPFVFMGVTAFVKISTVLQIVRSATNPGPHRDPFDRTLIARAQAQAEGIAIASNERIFDAYGVTRIW